MPLIGKRAGLAHAGAYEAPPRGAGRALRGPLAFVKNAAQGACSGLLTLLGALHLSEGVTPDSAGFAALTNLDAATLDRVVVNFLDGGVPGAIEIIGAGALFMNAGRGWARVLGLAGFVALALAHANGVDHAELVERLSELYEAARSAVHRIETARSAA